MKYVIEKGISIPSRRYSSLNAELLETLTKWEVGDSFLISEKEFQSIRRKVDSLHQQTASRKEGDLRRVWRLK